MIIHVSSSQCLLERKAPLHPFSSCSAGVSVASSSLNKTSVFLEKWRNRVTSPSNPPRRDLAPLLPLKLAQHGERCARTGENSLQETLVILCYHSAPIRTPPPPPYRRSLFFRQSPPKTVQRKSKRQQWNYRGL